jgi:transposase InsO family protein
MIPDRLAEPGRPRDTGPAFRGLLLGMAVFAYIELFYNRQRVHATLDYLPEPRPV